MAKAAADGQHIEPIRDQGAGVRVAKGMKHHSRQVESQNGSAPVSGQVVGGKRKAIWLGEHQRSILRPAVPERQTLFELLAAVRAECNDHARWQRHDPPAVSCFWQLDAQPVFRLLEPLQTGQF